MNGWNYLPRFIDKIRLYLAGKLHADYQANFAHTGFDGQWLKAAGLSADEFIAVVKNSLTDGQVFDWVRQHVQKSAEEKAKFNQWLLNRGREESETAVELAHLLPMGHIGSLVDPAVHRHAGEVGDARGAAVLGCSLKSVVIVGGQADADHPVFSCVHVGGWRGGRYKLPPLSSQGRILRSSLVRGVPCARHCVFREGPVNKTFGC